jgi:tRNA-modifying protein YgfZ
MIIHSMQTKLNGVARLGHLGVIRVEGVDAASFLHGQLTQDFSLLGLSEARLAAYCSAQGRMLASFCGFKRSHTEILLVCDRDLLTPTLQRMSRFVMRAKAKLTDASDEYGLFGLAGEALAALAGSSQAAWSKIDINDASVVFLYPADGAQRALWLAPVAQAAPAGLPLSAEEWVWGEVRSGIAMISAATVDAFVPQMLNYESVGGVNFKKGCYPGQEVVARSQFRGTLKRRAFMAHSDAAIKAGDEVFQDADAEQPCGIVAQAAAAGSGGFDAIVSMQVAAAQAGGLHLGSVAGSALAVVPAPYPLLADI